MIKRTIASCFILITLMGCGFHLRGTCDLPDSLKQLRILPHQPYNAFHRALSQVLKSNGVQLIQTTALDDKTVSTLTILEQQLSEKIIAYGTNGLPSRALLTLKIRYQLTNPRGELIKSDTPMTLERELGINPNGVLGTDNERHTLETMLYQDAAQQLVRQLSIP